MVTLYGSYHENENGVSASFLLNDHDTSVSDGYALLHPVVYVEQSLLVLL